MKRLNFRPLPGLSSCHLQTILASLRPPGPLPPSTTWHVPLGEGDQLACEVSVPSSSQTIVVLVHGLGGSSESGYMVRLARKFYQRGIMAVRVNLRGCGSGKGLSSRPYHAGRSDDLDKVIQELKRKHPEHKIYVIGFSLGANISLKLAGERKSLADMTIAVCPPIDLGITVKNIQSFYHKYYLKKVCQQGAVWLKEPVSSLYEFDDKVTAPLWGFKDAAEYYAKSSSLDYLFQIEKPCKLLFAEDDPFIPCEIVEKAHYAPVEVYTTSHGGHMGFLGYTAREHKSYWLDETLLAWVFSEA